MIKRLLINSSVTKKAIEDAIKPQKDSNFFENFRAIFYNDLSECFRTQGLNTIKREPNVYNNPLYDSVRMGRQANSTLVNPIKVTSTAYHYRNMEYMDVEFCLHKGMGNGSILSLNYSDEICYLPSLSVISHKTDFSLGNFYFPLENGGYSIEIECEPPLTVVGYSQYISHRKSETSRLAIAGVHFYRDWMMNHYSEHIKNCTCSPSNLDEIEPCPSQNGYPTIFICRVCGKLYVCKCFEGYLPLTPQFDGKQWMVECSKDLWATGLLGLAAFKENICHLCTGTTPRYKYGSDMYYSSFLQSYLPYFHLYSRKFPTLGQRDAEDRLRDDVGHAKVGEKWSSETKLYNIVQQIFPSRDVIFHYRGEELQGLELDIWVPGLLLGFEYQGIQHYEPVEHWGGEAAFKKLQERDKLKRTLCKALGYNLVEVSHELLLSKENIIALLPPYTLC